jgi:hypothetical protein
MEGGTSVRRGGPATALIEERLTKPAKVVFGLKARDYSAQGIALGRETATPTQRSNGVRYPPIVLVSGIQAPITIL